MKLSLISLVAIVLALSTTSSKAQIINVQFNGGDANSLNGQAWSSTIAPLAYSGTTWTSTFNNSVSNLLDSNGNATSVAFDASFAFVSANGSSSLDMFKETSGTGGGDITLTISGLANNQAYNLFLGSAYANTYGSNFTVGSKTFSTTGADATFTNGQSYVEFTNIVPISNSITVTVAPGPQGFAILNGFQIEPAAVPEPSTYAMIGLGLLSLLAFGRLRKLFV